MHIFYIEFLINDECRIVEWGTRAGNKEKIIHNSLAHGEYFNNTENSIATRIDGFSLL